MDKQLIKTFSEIKSSCKTRNQRLAFNELIKSFATSIIPLNSLLDENDFNDIKDILNELDKEDPGISKIIKDHFKKYKLSDITVITEDDIDEEFYDNNTPDKLNKLSKENDYYYYVAPQGLAAVFLPIKDVKKHFKFQK